jgi:tetratricopeptide (TPR) repeat protein
MSSNTRDEILRLIQHNRLTEARTLCERWCQRQRVDAEAWFLLGSIDAKLGKLDIAIENLRHSLSINSQMAMTHNNLGMIYLQAGNYPQARACFEKALSLQPELADARLGLANTLLSAGAPMDAIPHFEQVLQIAPASPAVLLGIAHACVAAGDRERARNLLQNLPTSEPFDINTGFRIGNLFYEIGDYEQALAQFTAITSRHPELMEAGVNRGNTLAKLARHDEAVECYRQVLARHPEAAAVHFNLGNTLRDAGRGEAAVAAYRNTLRYDPGMSGALNNLGLLLGEQGDNTGAVECFHRAIASDPGQVDGYINLANHYRDAHAPDRAIATLKEALTLMPEQAALHGDLALLLLRTGNFEEGWEEYEWRQPGGPARRAFPLPGCAGAEFSDRTVLVAAEQGIGDEIMFASCIPDLVAAAAHVVIDCEPRLAPLFARSFPDTKVHGGRQTDDLDWLTDIPAADCVIHAGSLPRHFRRRLADFPTRHGYLRPAPDRIDCWRKRYAGCEGRLNVGISWRGGHLSQGARRSTRLNDWDGILTVPGICFVNVQYGNVCAELDAAAARCGVRICHWPDSDPLSDMDDFAAQLAALDLVISIDNSTVHLAGALGVETWLLQPPVPDWRWLEHADDSYWYPSVRQFHPPRQGRPGELLASIRDRLATRVAGSGICI